MSSKRVDIRTEPYRFDYDLTKLPTHKRPFLGLYEVNGQKVPCIIWRSPHAIGLRFLSDRTAPHYIGDPIAWAELPIW